MGRRKSKHSHSDCSAHHLLWERKVWSSGCRLLLRRAFVYEIPKEIHHELHTVVEPIPPLTDDEARWLWAQYKKVAHEMDIFEALDWLYANAPNLIFMKAIAKQREFLQNNMGRS